MFSMFLLPSGQEHREPWHEYWATALLHVLNSPAFQSLILQALVSLHLSLFLWCGSSTQADHQRLIYNWANTLIHSRVTLAVESHYVDVDQGERERTWGKGGREEEKWRRKKWRDKSILQTWPKVARVFWLMQSGCLLLQVTRTHISLKCHTCHIN